MTRAKSNEAAIPMDTNEERMIRFIIKSVQAGLFGLAKMFIDHDQNLVSAFYKIQSEFLSTQREEKGIQPALLAPLYHHELQRVLTEDLTSRQLYLALLDIYNGYLNSLRSYGEEQFAAPGAEFIATINNSYHQFIAEGREKLLSTLRDRYKARIDDNSDSYVWFDRRCYTITRNRDAYSIRLRGVAHFTEEQLDLAQTVEEREMIIQLIEDCEVRNAIVSRQFSQDKIDTTSDDFKQLNIILLRMNRTYERLIKFARLDNERLMEYFSVGDDEELQHHDDAMESRFDVLVDNYFPPYDFDESYSENLKQYEALESSVNELHDALLEWNTSGGMHLDMFMKKMFTLEKNEMKALKKFLGCDDLSLEMISELGERVLPLDRIVDEFAGNNLLQIALHNIKLCEPFITFLLQQKANIFFENKQKRRPIDIVAENCFLWPNDLYRRLIEYAKESVRPYCINPKRSTQVNTPTVVIEKLFNDLVEYLERRHYTAVKAVKVALPKKPKRSDMTARRALNIAECFSFFYDNLSNLPESSTMDLVELKRFVSKLLKNIVTVLSRRRSELYRNIAGANDIIEFPMNNLLEKQCTVIKELENRIELATKEFVHARQQLQEQHAEMLKVQAAQQKEHMQNLANAQQQIGELHQELTGTRRALQEQNEAMLASQRETKQILKDQGEQNMKMMQQILKAQSEQQATVMQQSLKALSEQHTQMIQMLFATMHQSSVSNNHDKSKSVDESSSDESFDEDHDNNNNRKSEKKQPHSPRFIGGSPREKNERTDKEEKYEGGKKY